MEHQAEIIAARIHRVAERGEVLQVMAEELTAMCAWYMKRTLQLAASAGMELAVVPVPNDLPMDVADAARRVHMLEVNLAALRHTEKLQALVMDDALDFDAAAGHIFRRGAEMYLTGCHRLLSLLATAHTCSAHRDKFQVAELAARLGTSLLVRGRAGLLSIYNADVTGCRLISAAMLGGGGAVTGEVDVLDSAVHRRADQVLDFWRRVHLLQADWAYTRMLAGVTLPTTGTQLERQWQASVLTVYR